MAQLAPLGQPFGAASQIINAPPLPPDPLARGIGSLAGSFIGQKIQQSQADKQFQESLAGLTGGSPGATFGEGPVPPGQRLFDQFSGVTDAETRQVILSGLATPLKPSQGISLKKLDKINELQAKEKSGIPLSKPEQGLLRALLVGSAGININLGRSTGGERTAIAEGEATLGVLDTLEELFKNKNTRTGPVVGRIDPIKGLVGFTSQEQEEFMAATSAFKNQVIKAITGAQMSEPEAKRIMKQIPDTTDPPDRWKAKFKATKRNMERLQIKRSEVLKRSGITSPLDDGQGGFNIQNPIIDRNTLTEQELDNMTLEQLQNL
jgi:hypothetical protein